MSELKPGDRVWIRGFYVEWATDNTRHISDLDDPETAIPDVPNLAAVARVLSAHPGIGLSCDKIITYVSGVLDLMDSFAPEEKRLNDRMRKEVDALRALAAALNGGTA